MSAAIGSVGQLVSVIRAELTGRAPAQPGKAEGRGGRGQARYADHNLAGLIEVRIKHIARDDPQRGRKALRVFLEAVLLSHFGEQMLADPKFYQMLDEVQQAMEADGPCAELVEAAIGHLLARSA